MTEKIGGISHGILTFHISQIKNESPTTATLSGTFSLAIPSDLQAAICEGAIVSETLNGSECSEKGSIATEKSVCLSTPAGLVDQSLYQLKQKYASKILTLSVESAPHGRSISANPLLFSTTIQLGKIFLPSQSRLFSPGSCSSLSQPPDPIQVSFPMTVTLPLSSQSQAYPDDWYAGTVWIYISLPSPLYIPNQLMGGFPIFYLPMDLKVAANTSMSNYTMQIVPGTTDTAFPQGSVVAGGSNELLLLVTRKSSFWWFIYSTTFLIPLAFFLLFGHVLFLSKQKDREPLHTTLLNVLIMVVTVAAIRQFLVPADLQGITTRLDLWLSMWGMILLVLFFIKYAWMLIRKE